MTLIANVNRDPKKHRPFKPADFDPFPASAQPAAAKVGVGVLKTVFIDRRMPNVD